MTPNCEKCGAPMVVLSRFKFDHEPTDSDRDRESLRMFKAMGVELGADVGKGYRGFPSLSLVPR
jgi:hypothetical protein